MEMSRSSLIASAAFHVILIGFGLVSLSSPRSLDVSASDAISVEFVPVEDNAQSVIGDEKAPMDEKPAPTPTTRPDEVADAQNIGDNSVDSKAPPVPEAKPRPVDVADAQKPQEKPTENPKPEETVSTEEPQPVPATEVAPIPTPRQEVTPDPVKTADVRPAQKPQPPPQEDPVEKAIAEEEARIAKEMEAAKQAAAEKAEKAEAEKKAAEEKAELAEKKAAEEKAAADAKAKADKEAAEKKAAAAKAQAKKEAEEKKAAEAKAAKAQERKKAEKAAQEAASRSGDQGELEDDISDLLNKEKSGGGGKRATQNAALGSKRTTGGKLSQSEMGSLRQQLGDNWTLPGGMEDASELRVTVRAKVGPDGKLQGRPTVEKSSGNQAFDDTAIRAVLKADRQGLVLPAGKEDIWSEIVINFDPQDMLY